MLRLFLRLYVILALGLAGAIWLVNYTFDELLPEANETYNREALRGPAYGMVEQLRPLQGEARQARLAELQPHYGLPLKLVEKDSLALTEREQKLLGDDLLVVRGDFKEFLTRIDTGPQLLEIKLPEEPKWLYLWAYGFLGLCLALVLYFWVRPHWRDLEHIRLAAQRFGDNDLCSRILLPRRSTVRELAGHFNQMAERIESLIANQRELTNAVSHELRTPIARLSFELDQLKQQADPRQSRALIADMYAGLHRDGDAERWRSKKNVMLGLVVVPFFTNFLIRTLAWKTILADDSPVVRFMNWSHINDLLTLLHLTESGRVLNTPLAVVLGLTYNFLPFMVLPLYASLDRMDPRLVEAAQDLYSSPWTALRKITWPLSLPGVVAGTLLTFIPAAGDYINAELLGTTKVSMIGNVIQDQFFVVTDYPTASALSFVLMLAILVLVFFYVRRSGTEDLV